jgi:hypothetical protein
VTERVDLDAPVLRGHEHVVLHGLAQRLLEVGLRQARHLQQGRVRHPAAGHRRHPDHLLGVLGEPLDPRQQHVDERGRQARAVLGVGGEQLLGEERVALRAAGDLAEGVLGQQLLGECGDEPARVGVVERAELQPLRRGQPDQLGQHRAQRVAAMQVVAAVRADDQQPLLAQPGHEEGEQPPGGGVRPVQVLEDEHDDRLRGEAGEQGVQGVEQLQLADVLLGAAGRARARPRDDGADPRHAAAGPFPAGQDRVREQPGQRGMREHGPLTVGDLRHRLDERQVGQSGLAGVQAPAGEHHGVLVPRQRGELLGEPGLADPGVAGDQHGHRGAGHGLLEGGTQPAHLPVACHQGDAGAEACHARMLAHLRRPAAPHLSPGVARCQRVRHRLECRAGGGPDGAPAAPRAPAPGRRLRAPARSGSPSRP